MESIYQFELLLFKVADRIDEDDQFAGFLDPYRADNFATWMIDRLRYLL